MGRVVEPESEDMDVRVAAPDPPNATDGAAAAEGNAEATAWRARHPAASRAGGVDVDEEEEVVLLLLLRDSPQDGVLVALERFDEEPSVSGISTTTTTRTTSGKE